MKLRRIHSNGTVRRALFYAAALSLLAPTATLAHDNWPRGDRVFFLTGSSSPSSDPENPENEAIQFEANSYTNTASGIVRIFSSKHAKVQLRDLDNQLEVRHRFQVQDTCGGGSPALYVRIDLDGDGDFEGSAVASFGTVPLFRACQARTWLYEDFTGGDGINGLGPHPSPATPGELPGGFNEEREWDAKSLTDEGELDVQFPFDRRELTFSDLAKLVHDQFPSHRVCSVLYLDKAGAGPLNTPKERLGVSHVDALTIGDATLNGWEDLAERPKYLPSDTCKFKYSGHHDEDDDDDNHHDDDD